MHLHTVCCWTFMNLCSVLPAFVPQTIFITESFLSQNFYYFFQIVRVISPSHKISFLRYSSIIFWCFFRVLCMFWHAWFSFFFRFIIHELLLLCISWFWVFVKILHFICDDTNPVQFQTSEIKRRISFLCEY